MDMGVWEHRMYLLLHAPGEVSLLLHRPLFFLYAPLYGLGGMPLLLLLQAAVLALSGWVLYRLARIILHDELASALVTLGYLLYWPLWYAGLYDFHTDHWFPLLFLLLYGWEIRREIHLPRLLAVTLLLFIAKEITPFVLLVYFLCAYVHTAHKTYWRLFLFTALAILAGLLIMPYGVAFRAPDALGAKAFFFACMGLPFLGLFVLRPTWLAPILFPTVFILFASSSMHYAIGNQYPSIFTAPLAVAALLAIPRLAGWLRGWVSSLLARRVLAGGILASSLLFHVLLAPTPLSRQFWFAKYHSAYHYSQVIPTERDRAIRAMVREEFPDGAYKVCVQNSAYTSQLARQPEMQLFPRDYHEADRIVVDTHAYGEVGQDVNPDLYAHYLQILNKRYRLVRAHDGYKIYAPKKNPSQQTNQ